MKCPILGDPMSQITESHPSSTGATGSTSIADGNSLAQKLHPDELAASERIGRGERI
jgi:hypothetical protein